MLSLSEINHITFFRSLSLIGHCTPVTHLGNYMLSIYSWDWASRGADSPERPNFLFVHELPLNAQWRQWCFEKSKQLRKSILSFLKSATVCIHFGWNDDIAGKGKIEQLIDPFSFSLSFSINKQRVESIGRMCLY